MPAGENLLQTNIHQVDNPPRLHTDSNFFQIADKVEKLDPFLENFLEVKKRKSIFVNPPELARFYGNETQADTLIVSLDLPAFPSSLESPKIIVFGTPDNYAMTVGRFRLKQKTLSFQLARFHLGAFAELDMPMAMWPLAQVEEVKKLLGNPQDSHKKTYAINISREGHLTSGHTILARQGYPDIPYTIAHAEHQKDPSNRFGRAAKVCQINFEGMNPHDISLLVVSDNTASGQQQVAVIDEALTHIKNLNLNPHRLTDVLILSPLLTLYGASIISYHNASEGIATTFVTSGGILGCNPPDRYFSPLKFREFTADPRIVDINHMAHGKTAGIACVRCNWTASFAAPRYALEKSEEELKSYGSSNAELFENSRKITPELVRSLGVDPKMLVPYSAYLEAEVEGKLALLHEILNSS